MAIVGVPALLGLWLILSRVSRAPGPTLSAVVLPKSDDAAPAVLALVEERAAAVRQAPADPKPRGDLGLAYEANGLWAEAIECYAQAERLEPNTTAQGRLDP